MTGNHGMPNRRPDDGLGQVPQKPVKQKSVNSKSVKGIPPLRFPGVPPEVSVASTAESRQRLVPPVASAPATPPSVASAASPSATMVQPPPEVPGASSWQKLPAWMPRHWQFWGAVSVLAFSGLGIFSALNLFSLPATPNCPAIFLPTASASMRLYCAQTLADKHTVEALLKAIALVNGLPSDHPLRPEIDRNIETWSTEILQLAGESFQNGELEQAINTANRIPAMTAAHQLVGKQVKAWKELWAKAEKIYQDAEESLQQNDLRQAFLTATRLLSVGNRYWETTKYKALSDLITDTRVDGSKLDKAKGMAEQGSLKNVLAAIKLVEEIKPKSHLYSEATQFITEFGQKILDLAEAAIDRRNYNEAISLTQQIPDRASLQAAIQDFNMLAQARAQAWGGTTDDLQSAIQQAQKLKSDRPLYGKAQALVSSWQLETQDIIILERARQLAQPGTIGDLTAAVAEAQRIPASNPRGKEAQDAIEGWTATLQTIEDRPYLDRAEQYASGGDVPSLQRAINEASRIGVGRSLSDQADQHIRDWAGRIQRAQDQPILDQARQLALQGNLRAAIDTAAQIGEGRVLSGDAQAAIRDWTQSSEQIEDSPYLERARQLASQGDLAAAIATAEQIRSGRSLYEQAQADIRNWRNQSDGQGRIQQAYDAAKLGTAPMLLSAIQIADQVPAYSADRPAANRLIDQWSFQILQIAEGQAQSDIGAAITIADSIPASTKAYSAAQQDIQTWRLQLRR
jgi:soluble cytochrome b562